MFDPKMGASGAQLSASTRRAMARRRKLANSGPKLVNPMKRPAMTKQTPEYMPVAPTESAPGSDAPVSNTASRGVSRLLTPTPMPLKLKKKGPMVPDMSAAMDRGVRKALGMRSM
jgi:hypothetical protein